MTTTETAPAKRSFDFKRTDHYLCDPIADLCIFGGRGVLLGEQLGEQDTIDDSSHPLHDPRIHLVLEESFVRSIDAKGVEVPIIIAKLDDLAMVVEGRQRVKGARVANRRRALRGESLIKVPCLIKRVKDRASLMLAMVSLNEQRTDDDFASKMAKLRRLMDAGIVDHDELGDAFKVSASVIESWLRFDTVAIERVRDAVEQGRIALSAGFAIARLKEPALQARALDAVQADASASKKSITQRKAREAAKLVEKPDAHMGVADKRTQKKLQQLVEKKGHAKGASKETLAWWSGVEAALSLIVGGDEKPDERLLALLGEARIANEGKS